MLYVHLVLYVAGSVVLVVTQCAMNLRTELQVAHVQHFSRIRINIQLM